MEDNVLDKMVKTVLKRCNYIESNIRVIRIAVDEFLKEIRSLERKIKDDEKTKS